mgnify:CR=1 FL=1
MPTTGPVKCSGLAQQFDEKPKRELFSVLAGQGVGEGQVVVSVSGRRHERARNAHQSLGSGWYSGLWMFNTRLPRNHRTLRRSKSFLDTIKENGGTQPVLSIDAPSASVVLDRKWWNGWYAKLAECYQIPAHPPV